MAIKSMTGFGRGESSTTNRYWVVEVRCVNHRYLDFRCRLPRGYHGIEDRIRKKVEEFHQRGRVELNLTVSGDFTDLLNLKVNGQLAAWYKKSLEEMADELDLDCRLSAMDIGSFPEVIISEQLEENLAEFWPHMERALTDALTDCSRMRSVEGRLLAEDLQGRLDFFAAKIAEIEQHLPELMAQREAGLKERLERLLDKVQLDPARLAQEAAILADKTDVTEEIVRLKCHMEQFGKFLGETKAVGRKLDFLIQEFLREVNTISSKISDVSVAHLTVELKSELEKMREQVQNIE
ncbi:MAG: YicC family protein [Deltaproteobacteria bacterium]|nr:MAG: YicC family protein [Deltaproteobacteria bacterium]